MVKEYKNVFTENGITIPTVCALFSDFTDLW